MNGYTKIIGVNLDCTQEVLLGSFCEEFISEIPQEAEPDTFYLMNDYDYRPDLAVHSIVITYYPDSFFPLRPRQRISRSFHPGELSKLFKNFIINPSPENRVS